MVQFRINLSELEYVDGAWDRTVDFIFRKQYQAKTNKISGADGPLGLLELICIVAVNLPIEYLNGRYHNHNGPRDLFHLLTALADRLSALVGYHFLAITFLWDAPTCQQHQA